MSEPLSAVPPAAPVAGAAGRAGFHLGRGEAWALAAALFYALSNVFTGYALQGRGLNYVLGVSLRAVPTFLLSIALGWCLPARTRGCTSPFSDRKLLLALIGNGLLTFVIGGPMSFAALQQGGVLIGTPVMGTQVLWGALIAAAWLHEPLNRRMVTAMLVSLLGVVVLTLGKSGSVAVSPNWWVAIPLALGTALSWGLSGVLITYAMRRGVDRFQALFVGVVVSLLCLNGYLAVTGNLGVYGSTPPSLLLIVVVAGVLGMAGLVSVTSAMSLTTVASATTLNSLQVALAPLIAWGFIGEHMNLPMAAGIALIMVGVLLFQRGRRA